MDEFEYKKYTLEEKKIYNEALPKIIEGLKKGLKFNEACAITNVEDKDLKEFIIDDALKVMIAELHYAKRFSLQEVADRLDVPIETINKANREMLEDVKRTARAIFKMENPDTTIGDA